MHPMHSTTSRPCIMLRLFFFVKARTLSIHPLSLFVVCSWLVILSIITDYVPQKYQKITNFKVLAVQLCLKVVFRPSAMCLNGLGTKKIDFILPTAQVVLFLCWIYCFLGLLRAARCVMPAFVPTDEKPLCVMNGWFPLCKRVWPAPDIAKIWTLWMKEK